jgi:hypothetical protein
VPVTVKWDNSEKTTLCYRLEGRWTWEELYHTLGESRKLWGSVNHVVDVLIDLSVSTGFPAGNILGHFRNVSSFFADVKTGNTAVAGADDFFRMSLELFYKVYIRERKQPLGNTLMLKDMDSARAALTHARKNAEARN